MQKAVLRYLVRLGILVAALVGGTSLSAQDPIAAAKAARDSGDIVGAARILDAALASNPTDFDLLIAAGQMRLNDMEQYSQAADLFRRALAEKRKNPIALRGLGTAQSLLGDCAGSIETLQSAMAADKDRLESYLALGNAYLVCGADSLSKAELMFQSADNKFPKDARVALALGDLYYSRQIYELAHDKYTAALAIDPNLIETRIRLGRANRELAKRAATLEEAQPYYLKALIEFNQVTVRAPNEPQPWREQGEIFMLAQEWEKAFTSFSAYRRLRPDDPRGDTLVATAAIKGSFYQLAIEPLVKSLARSDSISNMFRPRARFMLGKSYYAVQRYDSSRMVYEKISDSAMSADLESAKYYASAIMQSGGDTLKALGLYDRLSASNPTDCELSTALGDILYKRKRYEDVITAFNRRLSNCPDQPTALPMLYIGLSHFALKRYDLAIESLRRSADADTASAQALYWLMNAYAAKKQFAKAGSLGAEMIARGVEQENRRWIATAQYYSGVDRFVAKKYKDAVTEFQRSTTTDPTYSEPLLYMAFCYQSMNDKENACKYYKLVVQRGNAENVKIAKENMEKIGCS